MPNFADPLTGISPDHKLSKDELARAIRFMTAAEFEAIEMYSKVRDCTDDENAKKVILSIVNEEKVHAGEFLKLLSTIDPKEAEFYADGEKEVSELLEKSKKAYKITRAIDQIAAELEPQDKVIALALDNVSDAIENLCAAVHWQPPHGGFEPIKGLTEEERAMLKLLKEHYQKNNKGFTIDDIKDWRAQNSKASLGDAIQALFKKNNLKLGPVSPTKPDNRAEEQEMIKLLTEEYKKQNKILMDEIKKLRSEKPELSTAQAIKELFNKIK
jgi:rubrerythrin